MKQIAWQLSVCYFIGKARRYWLWQTNRSQTVYRYIKDHPKSRLQNERTNCTGTIKEVKKNCNQKFTCKYDDSTRYIQREKLQSLPMQCNKTRDVQKRDPAHRSCSIWPQGSMRNIFKIKLPLDQIILNGCRSLFENIKGKLIKKSHKEKFQIAACCHEKLSFLQTIFQPSQQCSLNKKL